MTLLTVAMLAAGLAVAPSEAGAAATAPVSAPAAAPLAPSPAEPGRPQAAAVGGPIEPVVIDVSGILVEGRKAEAGGRWTGAVDPSLERRYGPRDPVRYNQITIEF